MRRPLLCTLLALALGAAVLVPDAGAAPAASPRTNLATARVKLRTVATGLSSPVALAWRAGRPLPIYVAEQGGTVVAVANGHIVRTVLRPAVSTGSERGLLGIVFSRDGSKLYVDHTDVHGDIRIAEYRMRNNVAVAASRRVLLTIPHHTFSNHNGGDLVLGADNMLYISVGDGGGGGDPLGSGQNLNTFLGKILRIDPRPLGKAQFRIPKGNPFAGQRGRKGAIWMYGLRNPWRFSFDRKNHDMWIGDVGQNAYEEIDYALAGRRGINWGWNLREGVHPYSGGARPHGAHDPITERPHTAGDCAIIGGFVYRAAAVALPLVGAYIFGDECTGDVHAIVQSKGHIVQKVQLNVNVPSLSTFGQGPKGAIYPVSLGGTIYMLAKA
jgi:glucose/arabinose dehydrogenase